ncbi:MAG: AbrB/MazE/SpoVT family DNA-binding domain-containing protein [Melioribacteraceae bacterium]|nr:AbrB/MazE/SpoVT family DNA-binding domain-containing protein [Melioribacteraceae bacterium]
MTTVTVSPKYQIVIPKEIRERLKITPGQKLQLFQIGDFIEIVPVMDIKEARGFLKGMGIDSVIEREEDRL